MVTLFYISLSVLIAAALGSGGLLLVLCIENRRFWKNRQQQVAPSEQRPAKVNLIIPCKGRSENSRATLEAFFFQNHPNFRITFAVESPTDPVVPLIRELQKEHRYVESSMVFAGAAKTCGQKVHNLLAAIDRLDQNIDIIAFADMDALVKPSWLRWLVVGVGRQGCGARTGYRWMVPQRQNLPTLLGVSLNNSIAACLGKATHRLVWGGSWAIHRNVFQQIGIGSSWSQVLSDDLAASRAIRSSKFDGKPLRIQFEPQCLCETEASFNWSSLFEFVVRQLKITRLYAFSHWSLALLTSAVTQVAFWGSVATWIAVMYSGDRGLLPTLLMFSFIFIYVLGVARGSMRQNMARRLFPKWRSQRKARNFDIFAWPITGLFALLSLVMSSLGNRVSWSNVHYQVESGGRTMIIGRNIETEAWPVRTNQSVPKPKMAAIVNAPSRSAGSSVEQSV